MSEINRFRGSCIFPRSYAISSSVLQNDYSAVRAWSRPTSALSGPINTQCRCQGETSRGLCPVCACAPAVPDRQAVVNAAPIVRISQYSFAHQQRPTFWRSSHQKAGFRKQILTKCLGLHANCICRRGNPIPHSCTTKGRTPVLGL